MQQIGLMMTCDEEDCIEEVMNEHIKYFDKILVLDGSSDRTEEIIRSYSQVKYFLKDKEIIDKLPGHRVRDGARQFLLAKAQELYGYDGWFTLLHGDEIFYDNPVKIAEQAEKDRAEKINWYVMNFFLHTSDTDKNLEAIKSVQERVRWYCPGFLEIRQFKNKQGLHYELDRHAKVMPEGIGWKMYRHYPIYKHYPYRSVSQMLKKKQQHNKEAFSVSYLDVEDKKQCFRDVLPGFKQAREFDGSFHEFEIKNQGSIAWRWLRSYRYLPIQIGNPFG